MLLPKPPIRSSGDLSPWVIDMILFPRSHSRAKHFRGIAKLLSLALIAMTVSLLLHAADSERPIKSRVAPVYPEIAKRMHISGEVKIAATVAPDGSVSATKAVSGNKMLSSAAEDAVHKWKFVAAAEESTVEVSINFDLKQ
jgi:TonB family protein